jgi:hypothetical protein
VVPRAGQGSQPQETLPNNRQLPQSSSRPPETEREVQEEAQGKPLPRTAARAGHPRQELGCVCMCGGGGIVPSKTDLASAPALTGTALPAPNFKRGGAALNSPPQPHTLHTHPQLPRCGETRGKLGCSWGCLGNRHPD